MVLVTAIVAASLAVLWFLAPFFVRQLSVDKLTRQCRMHRAIVLTYDDGPSPTLTKGLLDVLSRANVRATFFVLGRSVEAAPHVLEDIIKAGHEVGSHTYHHTNAWRASPKRALEDLDAGISLVECAGGDPRLFRPPYGKLTLFGLHAGARRNLRYGWWTVDSRDSWAQRPIDDVLQQVEQQGGGVILMHDLDSYHGLPDGMPHIDYVQQLTERLIALAQTNGFNLMSLGELYAKEGGH